MEYSTEVRQRFSVLASAGELTTDADRLVSGEAEDRSLGFWVRFEIEVNGDEIECARFRAFGCPHGLAAADLVADELQGKPVAALGDFDVDDIARRLELPREKLGKILRIEDALAACHRMVVSKEQG